MICFLNVSENKEEISRNQMQKLFSSLKMLKHFTTRKIIPILTYVTAVLN